MGLREVLADTALVQTLAGAGTYVSGSVANSGMAQDAQLWVHVSAVTGTPTLNVSLEESNDGTSWTAIPGSGIAVLSAAGNGSANARMTKPLVRATATVAGTTPAVTFRVVVLIVTG